MPNLPALLKSGIKVEKEVDSWFILPTLGLRLSVDTAVHTWIGCVAICVADRGAYL